MIGWSVITGPALLSVFCLSIFAVTLGQAHAQEGSSGDSQSGQGAPDEAASSAPTETITVTGEVIRGTTGYRASEVFSAEEVAGLEEEDLGEAIGVICPRADVEDEEGVLILINGEEQDGLTLEDIGRFPADAVERIEVLSPEAAAAFGREGSCAVINVVLKERYKNLRFLAIHSRPDRGHTGRSTAQINYGRIRGANRLFLWGRSTHISNLLESERDIIAPTPEESGFFASPGNILAASGNPDDEIDPALSALAGEPVTLVGLPREAEDDVFTLDSLLPFANEPAAEDSRSVRTLRQQSTNSRLGLYFIDRLSKKVRFELFSRLVYSTHESLNGFAQSALLVPPSNAFSPFDVDVTVNRLFETAGPIEQTDRRFRFFVRPRVYVRLGDWTVTGQTNYGFRRFERTQPNDPDQDELSLRLADDDPETAFDPFTIDGNGSRILSSILNGDRETSRQSHNLGAHVNVRGRPVDLPGGSLVVRARTAGSYTQSLNEMLRLGDLSSERFNELSYRSNVALVVPVLGDDLTLPGFDKLSLNVSTAHAKRSETQTTLDYGYGMTWGPVPGLTFSVLKSHTEFVANERARNEPVQFQDNVPIFDPLTQETVFVRVVTGGNPDLELQTMDLTQYVAEFTPDYVPGLTVKARYRDETFFNRIASLPAFDINTERFYPDRVVRDASGQLIEIDRRRLNLAQSDQGRVEVDVSYKTGGRKRDDGSARPFFIIKLGYDRQIKDQIVATPGAEVQDFLNGETGLTRPRDSGSFSFVASYQGVRLRTNVSYENGSRNGGGFDTNGDPLPDVLIPSLTKLGARLSYRFSETSLFKTPAVLDGLRLQVGVQNLLDRRRVVVDETGATPRLYQIDYQDPLGRTLFFEAGWKF